VSRGGLWLRPLHSCNAGVWRCTKVRMHSGAVDADIFLHSQRSTSRVKGVVLPCPTAPRSAVHLSRLPLLSYSEFYQHSPTISRRVLQSTTAIGFNATEVETATTEGKFSKHFFSLNTIAVCAAVLTYVPASAGLSTSSPLWKAAEKPTSSIVRHIYWYT
jgi:hypothetical protein